MGEAISLKVGKKKVYMTPSAAETQGLVRADKHPKSTRYGRQNPISERWNSEEQLAAWRAAWADVSNRYLERAGREERIDHRSNAARGLDEIPIMLLSAKQETSRLLGEDAENRQARQMIMRRRSTEQLKRLTLKRIDARSNVNDSAKSVVLCEYVIHVV